MTEITPSNPQNGPERLRFVDFPELKPIGLYNEEVDLPIAAEVVAKLGDLTNAQFTPDELAAASELYVDEGRRALALVATHFMEISGETQKSISRISKNTPQGRTALTLFHDMKDNVPNPTRLILEVTDPETEEIRVSAVLPLVQPQSEQELVSAGFIDRDNNVSVSYADLVTNPTLEANAHVARGIAFVAQNLLTWGESNTLLPNDINKPRINPPSE